MNALALLAATGLLLGGCAFFDPAALPPGTTADAVRTKLGEPTGRYLLPGGGQRLEYARGPYGKQTWMLDFDAAGTLTAGRQVLDEQRFAEIRRGMAADEVLQALGRPSTVWRVGWSVKQDVWSYRYDGPFCRWFMVGLDPGTRRVVDTAYGPDPLCETDLEVDL